MKIQGTPSYILEKILTKESRVALVKSASIYGQLLGYQAAAIFELAKKYDGQSILEIGTLAGYSASLLAQACPNSKIITLNSAKHEIPNAKKNLINYPNVEVLCKVSWDYIDEYDGPDFSMIFVDGDHVRVGKDMPWWCRLAKGGLMLFHDYKVEEIYVHYAVDTLGIKLGREPDIMIIDTDNTGMAGFYKKEEEIWPI